jgi:Methyltransferase domain
MFNFNEMVHEERSKRLKALPKFTGTVLSAGCSGTWYFKWFEECTGHKGKHIGLELYSQKPADLPKNIQWIANSVGDMREVESSSVDLLFSGQNIEHVSPEDLTGFLLESNRVLKNNGLLVIDSPNRAVTQHVGYIQPEHTLELTPDEAVALVTAAGFEVLDVYGLWLVMDPATKKYMDVFSCNEGELSMNARMNLAAKNPELSFIWWINAKKKQPANKIKLTQTAKNIFWKNYNNFIGARFETGAGEKSWNWGASTIKIKSNEKGYALYGPYIPLAGGNYQAIFRIKADELQNEQTQSSITFDVASAAGTVIHRKQTLIAKEINSMKGWKEVVVSFSLADYTTGIEARVYSDGFAGLILSHVSFLAD